LKDACKEEQASFDEAPDAGRLLRALCNEVLDSCTEVPAA
jgi:hypothetical protein